MVFELPRTAVGTVIAMTAKQFAKGLAVAVMGLCLTAAPAAARGGFHRGGGFRGGFGGGVVVRPFGFHGYYDPWFLGPYWYDGPYWGYGYSMPAGMGNVKIQTQIKDGEVFVDGAYAGTTGKTKDMQLKSGAHDIEIRAAGHPTYAVRVYVLSGKTLKISPGF